VKENPYLQFNFQMLKSFEKMYKEDIKDPTLSLKGQSNARTKLRLVQEAMKIK